jgi:N-methylhydantoinase A
MLDMRYLGQSYELTVPFTEEVLSVFHEHHHKAYGYSDREAALEIVNLRVRAVGQVAKPEISPQPGNETNPAPALIGEYPVIFTAGEIQVPFYEGEALKPGNQFNGPAVVLRSDTTILIGEKDAVSVDAYLNLIVNLDQSKAR